MFSIAVKGGGSLEVINPSSRAQNCSEVARSCAPVCHTSSHLQGRDVSECKTSIGSGGNQSVSTEELRSGTARVWISELGERVWHWHKEDGHLSPPAASFLHACPFIPSSEKQ